MAQKINFSEYRDMADSISGGEFKCPSCNKNHLSKNYMDTYKWVKTEELSYRLVQCSCGWHESEETITQKLYIYSWNYDWVPEGYSYCKKCNKDISYKDNCNVILSNEYGNIDDENYKSVFLIHEGKYCRECANKRKEEIRKEYNL